MQPRGPRLRSVLIVTGLTVALSGCVLPVQQPADATPNESVSDNDLLTLDYDPTTTTASGMAGSSEPGPSHPVSEPGNSGRSRSNEVDRAAVTFREVGTGTPDRNNEHPGHVSVTGSRNDVDLLGPERLSPEKLGASALNEAVDDALADRQQAAIHDLRELIANSGPLSLGQRLNLQGRVVELLAYGDLMIGSVDNYRSVLLEAFEQLDDPSPGLRLRMAAFYHDIGKADRATNLVRNETSAKENRSREVEDDEGAEETEFSIDHITPEFVLRKGKRRDFDLADLYSGDDLVLLASLESLTAKRVGREFEYKYTVEANLYNDQDVFIGYQSLGKNKQQRVGEKTSMIRISYKIPGRPDPGDYRLELKITDEFTNEQDLESVPIRINAKKRI